MWVILLKILAGWAWTYIVPFLFDLLKRKFGPGLIDFIYGLIGERHIQIVNDGLPPEDAEAMNLKIIKEATKSSPGLSTTWARFIHTIVYMKWTMDNVEVKFDGWIDNIIHFEYSGKNKTTPDFMSLYTSHPDWKKK